MLRSDSRGTRLSFATVLHELELPNRRKVHAHLNLDDVAEQIHFAARFKFYKMTLYTIVHVSELSHHIDNSHRSELSHNIEA